MLWLLNHPYQGVWHDGYVYGLIAAHSLFPEAMAKDLFFRFGSQGQLSLFTPLYGKLVGWLGLDSASWWVVISGGAGWVLAINALAERMLGPGFACRFAVLLAAVLTVSYSPNADTFVLNENFATARSWAIPFGVATVAGLAAGRSLWAALLAMISFVLHPLLGIWPLALCALAWLRPVVAVVLAVLVLMAAILVGLANPDLPFLRLMVGDWLSFARDDVADVMIKLGRSHLDVYGASLACLMAASFNGTERFRPIYRDALLLGVVGLCLSLLASLWLPVELLVQGQPWRVFWLLLPLAMVALLDVLQRIGRESRAGALWVAVAGVLAILGPVWWLPALYLLGVCGCLPATLWRCVDAAALQRRIALSTIVGLAYLLLLPGLFTAWDLAGGILLNPWWTGADLLHGLLAGGSWHIAALLALLPVWSGIGQKVVSGALFVMLGLGLVSVVPAWDRRPESRRAQEACYLDADCPPPLFRQIIAPHETVFWPGRELRVWFELNRPSYFGGVQRTGVVFSREKFDEWERRNKWVASVPGPAHLCTDRALDWLVLPDVLVDVKPRAAAGGVYLFSCADIRAISPAPTGSEAVVRDVLWQ